MLVIRVFRRTGDALPESLAARTAISKAYQRSPLRSESFNAHIGAVADALEIDEPLSWVETWVTIRTRPHKPPVDGEPIDDGQWSAVDVDDLSLDDVDSGR